MYQHIRDLREDKDMTQKQMAEILNCSQRIYSNYERGDVDVPTQILIKLAEFHNTSVDYPVVQGKDNDYYLHYTFKKDYLYSGTLFVDYRNSKSLLRNYNTVIYGHNMTDGSMFNTLYNFKDRKFFENGRTDCACS